MTNFESKIKDEIQDGLSAPCCDLRKRVLESAKLGHKPAKLRRRSGYGLVLAAALVILLSATTFAAYRADIFESIRISFGNSTAQTVETIDNNPYASLRSTIHNLNPEYFQFRDVAGHADFSSIEEAGAAAPFNFRVPTFLPEYLELNRVSIPYTHDGQYLYRVAIGYFGINYPYAHQLFITQDKVGYEAYIALESIYGIEKIMIGQTPAFGISHTSRNIFELIFINNGVYYHISGSLELSDLIAVAESLQNCLYRYYSTD
jgi:hypothetical protein